MSPDTATDALALPRLRWDAEALWLQLEPLCPGLSIEVLPQASSTNTVLLDRARQGRDTQPCLLVAEHQSAGRGRQGKPWQSAVGASLTFSLALPLAPADWSGLSLAVGLALADALEPLAAHTRPRLQLKWPNDLLLCTPDLPPRKLGGILIETVAAAGQRVAVVGVGLNVAPQAAGDAAALSWGLACVQELQPALDAPAALACVAAPLLRGLLQFQQHGFAPLRAAYARRDALAGQTVATTLPGLAEGLAEGVDEQGQLWLRRADGSRAAVLSGEVSVRRSAGGPC